MTSDDLVQYVSFSMPVHTSVHKDTLGRLELMAQVQLLNVQDTHTQLVQAPRATRTMSHSYHIHVRVTQHQMHMNITVHVR